MVDWKSSLADEEDLQLQTDREILYQIQGLSCEDVVVLLLRGFPHHSKGVLPTVVLYFPELGSRLSGSQPARPVLAMANEIVVK